MKLNLNQKKKKKNKGDCSDEDVRELISLQKDELVLYNSKHKKCYDKDEKQRAWKWIISKLISRGFSEIDDAQISEKITSLRSYYGTKKRKEKVSKASGARTSDVYVSSGRFINDLYFLNNSLIPRKSYSNIDLEAEEAFPSKESGGNISGRTGKIMELVSQRLLQDEKFFNAIEVKETAKSPE